jgi:anaerobic selenocysteine-containing dehydrogenase
MKRGTELIVIDPRINWLATRAKYVLQLRPGTDAALGLGLLNVIINEDLYDHDFVDNWTYGFEELKARVQDYPPSRVAAITWVAEEDIIEVAREMAKRPVTHGWGVSVDQNANGVQVGQVIVSIAAITGNLDNPGGTSLGVPLPGVVLNPMSSAGDLEPSELWDKIIGGEEFPAVKAAMRKVQPDAMLDALETDEPYKFHFAWWHSSNTIAPTNSAQPKRWHEALKRIDYTVCTDVFMTPTAMAFADIFLPVSTFAEHDGIVDTNYGLNVCQIGAINKALQVGECKSDIEILFELGRRIAPGRLPWKDPEEYFANVLNGAGMTFDDLRKAGTWQPGATYYKHEKGLVRPDGQPGFNTVTGKVELYALMYENFGDDPLPYFREPPFSAIDAPEYAEEYPLILTTGSRRFTSFHSEHRQIPTLRELSPNPLVQINPETAAKAGIKDGQWVKLENPFGSCKMVAMLTPIVPPKVVNAEHGWWFPEEDGEEPNLFGVWKSNVNSLIPHRAVGKMGFGAPYKSMICKISPVAE